MSTGTCVPLYLSGSFPFSLRFQAGWALVTQNPSSLGLLLLTRIIKVRVLPSCPRLSSHLSHRPQFSTLLQRLATISCLCGCPGVWGSSHSAAGAFGNHRPLADPESALPRGPWEGALAGPHSPASSPPGSYILRQPQETGVGTPGQ